MPYRGAARGGPQPHHAIRTRSARTRPDPRPGSPGPRAGETWCSSVPVRVEAGRIGRLVRQVLRRDSPPRPQRDRPRHTDGDRPADAGQRQAAARAARTEDDAQRDPRWRPIRAPSRPSTPGRKGHAPGTQELGERDRGERAAAGETVDKAHSERPRDERSHHRVARRYDPRWWSDVRVPGSCGGTECDDGRPRRQVESLQRPWETVAAEISRPPITSDRGGRHGQRRLRAAMTGRHRQGARVPSDAQLVLTATSELVTRHRTARRLPGPSWRSGPDRAPRPRSASPGAH